MQATVLILGAKGRFGLATARAFAAAGWNVVGHVRAGAAVPPEEAGDHRIRWLHADLFDTAALAQAAQAMSAKERVDVVVHALNPAYTNAAWTTQVLPMTDAAIALARALNATLMVPGNVYNFGAEMPPELREATVQQAQTVKGRIRIEMEERMRQSGVHSVVIRAGDFFGAGRGTWFDQVIVKKLGKGVFTYPGPLDIATAWAYLPDLAQTFVEVANRRSPLDRFTVFHFAGHCVSAHQWLATLAPVAQARGWLKQGALLRYKTLPWGIIRLGAPWVAAWGGLLEMRYLWTTPHRLVNEGLVGFLGAEPHTALDLAAARALYDLEP